MSAKDLKDLIVKRTMIDDRIRDVIKNGGSGGSEVQIKLLQRKKEAINQKIYQLCSPHEWGEASYGTVKCEVCEKIRHTKHW